MNNEKAVIKEKVNLPESFTIKMGVDFSSSGAGRVYAGELSFVNGILISGKIIYNSDDTNGVARENEYVLQDQRWMNSKTKEDVSDLINSLFPISKEKIEEFINLGKIKPKSQNERSEVFYELI